MAQRNFATRTDDELFADWLVWIERAYAETLHQAWRYRMFRLLRGMYEQNPELQRHGGFFVQWVAENYVVASGMAFRRELDTQSGTQNVYHLLREMQARPEVISRARFRSTWTGDSEYYTANRAFDDCQIVRIPGDPERDHIDPAMVQADLDRLFAQDAVLEHVQTTIAHRVPLRPNAVVPTYGDFHAAIDVLSKVFHKYFVLLTHRIIAFLDPPLDYNPYLAFRSPWITNAEQFDYKRCE